MASISETRLDSVLKKLGSLAAIVVISALLYCCFIVMRDAQPVFSTSQDVLHADTAASRVVDGVYDQSAQTLQLDFAADPNVSEISILMFRSGKAAQTASIQEQGETVSEADFSQENTLISYAAIPIPPSDESQSVDARSISLVLKGINSTGPGVVYIGPQESMSLLMDISAYTHLFEIGLLIAMVFYGSTLYYYKRSEDYMLRYVLYVLVLLCQAILFTSAWNVPAIELSALGRPFAVFTRIVAYMLSFYIAFRLMNVKMNGLVRMLFSGRAIVLFGLVCAAITWFFGPTVESYLTRIYNTAALVVSIYVCIIAKPKDTLIAAVLLISVLISANASFFGFLNLSDSLVFCVLFTTAPLFSLPFAVVVMFSVNRLFAKKFNEQELLAEELDSLVNQRTQELRRKEAQRRQMMLNIFHDLRTPLFVTKGCAEAILEHPEIATEKAAIIKGRVDFMTGLTNDLFNLAKLEEGRVLFAEDPINLKVALESAAGSWGAYKKDFGVIVKLSASNDIIVVGDQMRLLEAVQNLVDNAVHHSPVNGIVQVEAALRGDRAIISVTDEGPGMTEEECSVIFEYYYTNNRSGSSEGTGVGLPIAKEIVEHMEGTISVRSALDVGTTFIIDLPAEIDIMDEEKEH